MRPESAAGRPRATAARNPSASGIAWSQGATSTTASGSSRIAQRHPARTAGAVSRAAGSIRMAAGSTPARRSWRAAMKRVASAVSTTGGA